MRKCAYIHLDIPCTGTVLQEDSLDLLATFMDRGQEVADLTNKAMDGSMNLEKVPEIAAESVMHSHLVPSRQRTKGCAHIPRRPVTGTVVLWQAFREVLH
jgi:hypothetical protein